MMMKVILFRIMVETKDQAHGLEWLLTVIFLLNDGEDSVSLGET
jgi:hypothetical protein